MIQYPVNEDAEALRKAADEIEGIFTEERPEMWWVKLLDDALVKRNAPVETVRTALETLGYSLHHEAVLRVARALKYTTRMTPLAAARCAEIEQAADVLDALDAGPRIRRARTRTLLESAGVTLDDRTIDGVVRYRSTGRHHA